MPLQAPGAQQSTTPVLAPAFIPCDAPASTPTESHISSSSLPTASPANRISPALADNMSRYRKSDMAVHRLPTEIIQQILTAADPNTFASLSLLNSQWRRTSQQAHIYGLQLSRCYSFMACNKSFSTEKISNDDLPRLRRLFNLEVKRNLFDAYLRPSATEITLISNTISSASAPGGEGLQFSPSPQGHHILAYNSTRIYVIDVRGAQVEIVRELSIARRPVSTCVSDDGTLLAVLVTESQVVIYDLTQRPPKLKRSLILDHEPRTIALSPCGTVLAAAYDGGIEVSSLHPDAVSTDRRAVKCDTVDSLSFSFDGTQILGTTLNSTSPSTVVITAPYYDPGAACESNSALWTTSILFPNTSRDCSHSVLIQHTSHEEAAWTFTYDRNFETFRAVRIDDLRNGTTYFTGPLPQHQPHVSTKLMPCTLSASTYHGDLVSSGFSGKDVWLYGIPEDLEALPKPADVNESQSRSPGRNNSVVSNRSSPGPVSKIPQWKQLFDKQPNTFVTGFKVAELKGVSTVKFVEGHGSKNRLRERLVITARGVTTDIDEDDINFVDGGRITILDFDYGLHNGKSEAIEIELGTNKPEPLQEEVRDMATEVAIVRRRTNARNNGGARSSLLCAAANGTVSSHHIQAIPPLPVPSDASQTTNNDDDDDPLVPRCRLVSGASQPLSSDALAAEESPWESFDAPYSQQNPRSNHALRRAATAAAHRPLQPVARNITYRRADGRREHPHESDADNWVPPPPPYQKEDPGAVPNFLRQPYISPLPVPVMNRPQTSSGVSSSLSMVSSPSTSHIPTSPSVLTVSPISPQRSWTVAPLGSDRRNNHGRRISHIRTRSDSTIATSALNPQSLEAVASEGTFSAEGDLYDTSPRQSVEILSGSGPTNSQGAAEAVIAASSRLASISNTPVPSESRDRTPTVTASAVEPEASIATTQPKPILFPALLPTSTSTSTLAPTMLSTSMGAILSSEMQLPSMPQRPSTALPLTSTSAYPAGSSTFSPGGNDDYDPPATWFPSEPTTATGISASETSPSQSRDFENSPQRKPVSGRTWPKNDSENEINISPNRNASSQAASSSRAQQFNLNIDTSQFTIPRVPVASKSAGGPLRSASSIHPPPTLGGNASHGRSFSGSDIIGVSSGPSSGFAIFPDKPQLISTPTGVIGSYDVTTRSNFTPRPEMVIYAPVARRPQVKNRHGIPKATVERLERLADPTRPSTSSSESVHNLPLFPPLNAPGNSTPDASSSPRPRQLSSWMMVGTLQNTRTASIRRTRSHASRASRSAAKNVRDAKKNKKGWSASTTGARRRRKDRDPDDMSTSAWTDVPDWSGANGLDKDGKNKCVVM
ncbi:hypothetical protein TD95_000860 [Thielaviopsis punctulata]|uniref:F-box domain-containing protein n=1 Tax=Thielaviopsis punctulata TaxID=72032 RepID=A0A0F4Z882_9PEZI|nr:hypothetical protein TD95_000860 [Thielaviopsis punctulata]